MFPYRNFSLNESDRGVFPCRVGAAMFFVCVAFNLSSAKDYQGPNENGLWLATIWGKLLGKEIKMLNVEFSSYSYFNDYSRGIFVLTVVMSHFNEQFSKFH